MRPKKVIDEWVSGKEAADILSRNSKRTISPNYVRVLAGKNLIRSQKKDGRTSEYHKGDLMGYCVEPKSKADRATAEDGLPSAA